MVNSNVGARVLLRNATIAYLPSKLSHFVNCQKNLRLGTLEAEMPWLSKVTKEIVATNGRAVAVDVGANLGLFTQLLLDSGASVVAIEPNSMLSKYLTKVFGSKITCLNIGLSNITTSVELRIPRIKGAPRRMSGMDALATIHPQNTLSEFDKDLAFRNLIEVKTIDDLFLGQEHLDVIKIDVEGHELQVIQGGLASLKKHQPIIMCEIELRHGGDLESISAVLNKIGYRVGVINHENYRDLSELDTSNWKAGNSEFSNFIFVPTRLLYLVERA
ncbi:MAG: FkbM family methyltransferase [Actinomycetes bacterium]